MSRFLTNLFVVIVLVLAAVTIFYAAQLGLDSVSLLNYFLKICSNNFAKHL